MKEGGVIASEHVRHPTRGLHPETRAQLLELAREVEPLALRWGLWGGRDPWRQWLTAISPMHIRTFMHIACTCFSAGAERLTWPGQRQRRRKTHARRNPGGDPRGGARPAERRLRARRRRSRGGLFQADCYWRDLVTFTWNIRTMEGQDQIRDMLESQLAGDRAARLRLDPKEAPTASGDVAEGWITFETDVARGYGHIRLKDGLIWTLLTTMAELKGFEEPKGLQPAAGRGARQRPEPQDLEGRARGGGRRARLRDAALRRDHRRRPGRHRARRAAAPARRADHHRREERAARRQLAQALQVALPARPGLVRPPALHPVPGELAGLLAEGQDRRLAGDVHQGDGAQLLGLDRLQERHL